MRCSSSQRLNRAGCFRAGFALATTAYRLGDEDARRDGPTRIADKAPRVPPSSAPTGLAVGFGPKELSPTLLGATHPQDLLSPKWVPRPPAPPGGSASWHSVVTRRYTPREGTCQRPRSGVYSSYCLEGGFSEVRI